MISGIKLINSTARENENSLVVGQIYPPLPLTKSSFEKIIKESLFYHQSNFDPSSLAFSKTDWESLIWNTKEVFHLNSNLGYLPYSVRNVFINTDKLNFHLLVAFQKLALTWQPIVSILERENQMSSDCLQDTSFLVRQAQGLIEDAAARQSSLMNGKEFLRIYSIRQWRFFSSLFKSALTMYSLVELSKESSANFDNTDAIEQRINEIEWHLKTLRSIELDGVPSLSKRINSDYKTTIHFLAMTCHLLSSWQAPFIKSN